ncbi:MAG: zinc ABC transporter substrate-binding protein [Thiomicrospira sp.]|uniref:metal ABC transporter solute-binding protein, Zn/Mn family n=1 Tax=Thiomicrospira sp. TaxID=935 RepID=UPI0019E4E477|nr:zinc ABC transporter substrate-binding protein [Thiomicrospira sp.]MBE0493773.1 zinc ABC transporter substrate-binding protein [Thiomicrospira sp.]
MKNLIQLITLTLALSFSSFLIAKPKVLTTTNIVQDLVQQIGGDQIEASSLMGIGIDPHYYKATFGDMRKLAHADLVFYNGLGLEGRMQSVLENLASLKPVISVADYLNQDDLIYEQDVIDPHIWLNVRLWTQAAKGVQATLSEKLPEQADYFSERTEAYIKELNDLHIWIGEQINTIPQNQRILITAHDAFNYYGVSYGLDVMGLQGINTTVEFGLNDLRLLKEVIKQRQVKAVFMEPSVPKRSIESLIAGVKAEGGQLKLGGELLSDTLGDQKQGTDTYIGMLRHNTNTIVKALK